MKIKKSIILLCCVVTILVFAVICYFMNIKQKDLKENNTIVNTNDVIYLDNLSLKDYIFSNEEKKMISEQWDAVDVFDNDIFKIEESSEIQIAFNKHKIKPYGYIFLYSKSNYEDLKKWITLNYHNDSVKIYDDWIWFTVDNGEVRFYKNENDNKFRIVYVLSLPYQYTLENIGEYPKIIKFFLILNYKYKENN